MDSFNAGFLPRDNENESLRTPRLDDVSGYSRSPDSIESFRTTVELSRNSGYDPNLLVNGDFELDFNVSGLQQDEDVTGWHAFPDENGDRVLDVIETKSGNQLRLDALATRHDRIYQDVYTTAGQTYLLNLDIMGEGGASIRSESVHVFWDGEFIQEFRGVSQLQSFAVELTGNKTGFSRLELREAFEKGSGGDGLGPIIDNVSLLPVRRLDFGNGGFEQGPLSPEQPIYPINEIPDWRRGPSAVPYSKSGPQQEIRIRDQESGDYYWTLDSFANRYDGVTHNVNVEASQRYFLTYDMRSQSESVDEGNQLRIRFNNDYHDTAFPSAIWQTHLATFDATSTGIEQLGFYEGRTEQMPFGDGFGPWLDDFSWYELDTDYVRNFDAVIFENGQLINEELVNVQLVENKERATSVSFDITARFDLSDETAAIEDALNVYAVSSTDPSMILLDNGTENSSILTFAGENRQFPAGLVQFDGSRAVIDVSALPEEITEFDLLFQSIDTDGDNQSQYLISNIDTEFDGDGSAPILRDNMVFAPDVETDDSVLKPSNNVRFDVENIKVDDVSGIYQAEVRVTAVTGNTGREVVALFEDLPAGVSILNASGQSTKGAPYINFRDAIKSGGLAEGESSSFVSLQIESTTLDKFRLAPSALLGAPNQAPVLPAIQDITLLPGEVDVTLLSATDPDGDFITYNIVADGDLPTTRLFADGRLQVAPTPNEVGSYSFFIDATDGVQTVRQQVNVTVDPDPLMTTRIRGVLLGTDSLPLAGVPLDIGDVSVMSGVDGTFELDLGMGPLTDDTLRINGDQLMGPDVYPFVAEKLELLFSREVFVGSQNEIIRPIYLPILDVEGGTMVDPGKDTNVMQEVAPGDFVAVDVVAGTLMDDQGNPFNGVLSITEVPIERTPAALPENMFPDLVVTIQPGEMNFTQPAPVTFPNRSEFLPGTLLNLYSINPATGDFEEVGVMQVSADGTSIETISGGITSSSWHFVIPPPRSNRPSDGANEDNERDENKATAGDVEVELHSGAVLDDHTLASYQAFGQSVGLNLHYDSLRTDIQPIIHFGYDNIQVPSGPINNNRFGANLSFFRDGLFFEAPGAPPNLKTDGGGIEDGFSGHYWKADVPGTARVALQADLNHVESGRYTYQINSGFFTQGDSLSARSFDVTLGEIDIVNLTNSPFGAGWGLSGLWQIIENQDESVMLIDGGGSELYFEFVEGSEGSFVSPPGDFSTLERNQDGSYTRTLTDQTVYQFNSDLRIESVMDRVGNTWQYDYDANGIIQSITDPALLVTDFEIINQRIHSITDPFDRVTQLEYDNQGNLIRVTDPDQTIKEWDYDDSHRIISREDKRGNTEQIVYDFAGRAERSIRKDGSVQFYDPVQTQALLPFETTLDSLNAPSMSAIADIVGRYIDPNGRLVEYTLDQQGQIRDSADPEGGLGSVRRNDENLIIESIDPRGFLSRYDYDDQGNLTQFEDEIIRQTPSGIFAEQLFPVGDGPRSLVSADFDGDGISDVAVVNQNSSSVTVLISQGDSSYSSRFDYSVATGPTAINSADVNGDGVADLILNKYSSLEFSVLLGNGDGTFEDEIRTSVENGRLSAITTGDFNGDGNVDIAAAGWDQFNVQIYSGLGNGNFVLTETLSTELFPSDVVAADFDLDGNLDLAATSRPNLIEIFYGKGDGSFEGKKDLVVGGTPIFVDTADFNNDGLLDFVTVNDNSVNLTVVLSDGNGGYEDSFILLAAIGELAIADYNRDGSPDLAVSNVSNLVTVILGNPDGTFQEPTTFDTPSQPLNMIAVDQNSDGIEDLVLSHGGIDMISLLEGVGNGSFVTLEPYSVDDPISIVTADFNNDAVLDLLAPNYTLGELSLLIGNVDGTFQPPLNMPAGVLPQHLATGDLDSDGNLDFVLSNANEQLLSIYYGNGDATFATIETFDVGLGAGALTIDDADNDGNLDLFVLKPGFDGLVSVVLGNGDRTFQTPMDFGAGRGGDTDIETADFDNDGFIDIAIANSFVLDGDAILRFGNGDGTFPTSIVVPAGGWSQSGIAVGDLNSDGNMDFAVVSNSSTVSVVLGNGDGTFETSVEYPVSSGPSDIQLADLDNDGNLDILASNGTLIALMGVGDGTFLPPQNFDSGGISGALAVGDFNFDSFPDAVVSDRFFDFLTVHLNQGSGLLSPDVQPRRYTYDPVFNQLTSIKDELGRTTIYEIDPSNGNRLSTTRVVGQLDSSSNGETDDQITTYTYTTFGLVDTMTDPLGRVMDYDYDPMGRLMQVTFAVGTEDQAIQQFDYDAFGNQILAIDEEGNQTEFAYDALNRLEQITEADPDGTGPLERPITTFTYDFEGNLRTTTDAVGSTTTNNYDELNRLRVSVDDLGNTTAFTYDSIGNLKTTIDPVGNITTNVYDGRNRRISTMDPDLGVTNYLYDLSDNLIALTDPVGNRTRFFYDARSRLFLEADPFENETQYQYDAVNNLIGKIDRNNREIRYFYDDLDRLRTEQWFQVAGDATEINMFAYDYDLADNLISVVEDAGDSALTYTYDARDRVVTVSNAGTLGAPDVLLNYGYDDVGNINFVEETTDGVAGSRTDYVYDGLNRAITISQTELDSNNPVQVADKRVDFTYNAIDQYDTISRYSDLTATQLVAGSTFDYDEVNRLMFINHGNTGNPAQFAFFDFEYDAASRIRQITDIDGLTTYTYDKRSQLKGAERSTSDIRGNENYLYDANGNRVESHLHGSDYEIGLANRLEFDGTYRYLYDDEGNLIRQTVEVASGDSGPVDSYREFTWDHRNRLIAIGDFAADNSMLNESNYRYDGLDRRIAKTVNAIDYYFVYDQNNVILDFEDLDGNGGNAPALDLRYLHGPGIDEVLAQDTSTTDTEWLFADHLGTVASIVSSSQIQTNFQYDSFGNLIGQQGSSESRYRFTGREYDLESGLYFYRARYYDSATSVFLSEDPIGFDGGINNRSYVENSPINARDPFGLKAMKRKKKKRAKFKVEYESVFDKPGSRKQKQKRRAEKRLKVSLNKLKPGSFKPANTTKVPNKRKKPASQGSSSEISLRNPFG